MSIAVVASVAQLFHELRGCIAQMGRNRPRRVFRNERARAIVRLVHRIRFRGTSKIDRRLRKRELAFRAAESLVGFASIERDTQRARIGEPDVLDRHSHYTATDVKRIRAPVEHAHQPVQGRIGVRASNGLVQRRDLVVERITALVEAAQVARERVLHPVAVDLFRAGVGRGRLDQFEQVEQSARVTVAKSDHPLARARVERESREDFTHGAVEQLPEFSLRETLEHVHRGARKQRADHFKRGVLGRGTYESEQPLLHEWQECVLLRLVEAVHFIHEKDGALSGRRQHLLGPPHGVFDVSNAGKHGGKGDDLRVERVGHETRERRLADPRRPPQDHGMRLARLERKTQGLARSEQMLLPYEFVERFGPQGFGQRRHGHRSGKQIGHPLAGRGTSYLTSPITSAPLGGENRKSPGSNLGLRSSDANLSTVVWPKLSTSSMTSRPEEAKPMRILSKPPSLSRGSASSHSRPSFAPLSESLNARMASLFPASSAAGVDPSAWSSFFTVTCFRPSS